MSEMTELWYLPSDLDYATLKVGGLMTILPRYCRVFSCPEREMLTSTVPELAAELLDITNAPDWAARGLRPMRWGDAAIIRGQMCVYVPDTDTASMRNDAEVEQVLRVPKWPMAALVILRKSRQCQSPT